jgi:hypothetical protein
MSDKVLNADFDGRSRFVSHVAHEVLHIRKGIGYVTHLQWQQVLFGLLA